MSTALRIATWNLRRPKYNGWKNKPAILRKINEINADIWILTETNESISKSISPGSDYEPVSSTFIPDYHTFGESCVTIWSRHPIKPSHFQTFDPSIAVCAEVDSPTGRFLVYGTIITWKDDGVREGEAKAWERHYRSIANHREDWLKLRQQDLPFCVAGDFNEALHEPFAYGTPEGRAMLQSALEETDLVCVTTRKKLGYTIDHICLSKTWSQVVNDVNGWDKNECLNDDGNPVSDHNGVYADLRFD